LGFIFGEAPGQVRSPRIVRAADAMTGLDALG
jgi:hypothetical protein